MANKYEVLIDEWTKGAKTLRDKGTNAKSQHPKVAKQIGVAVSMLEECLKELKQVHENQETKTQSA
ncbi:hypothetical protein LCGC14_0391950 [marine sediment metagenome]|uniref:Uncharacterized protein n=1 Tax=marine sediment metagenome TaxID=412755 RepID=A0A0F9VL70_9ZZZZ